MTLTLKCALFASCLVLAARHVGLAVRSFHANRKDLSERQYLLEKTGVRDNRASSGYDITVELPEAVYGIQDDTVDGAPRKEKVKTLRVPVQPGTSVGELKLKLQQLLATLGMNIPPHDQHLLIWDAGHGSAELSADHLTGLHDGSRLLSHFPSLRSGASLVSLTPNCHRYDGCSTQQVLPWCDDPDEHGHRISVQEVCEKCDRAVGCTAQYREIPAYITSLRWCNCYRVPTPDSLFSDCIENSEMWDKFDHSSTVVMEVTGAGTLKSIWDSVSKGGEWKGITRELREVKTKLKTENLGTEQRENLQRLEAVLERKQEEVYADIADIWQAELNKGALGSKITSATFDYMYAGSMKQCMACVLALPPGGFKLMLQSRVDGWTVEGSGSEARATEVCSVKLPDGIFLGTRHKKARLASQWIGEAAGQLKLAAHGLNRPVSEALVQKRQLVDGDEDGHAIPLYDLVRRIMKDEIETAGAFWKDKELEKLMSSPGYQRRAQLARQ